MKIHIYLILIISGLHVIAGCKTPAASAANNPLLKNGPSISAKKQDLTENELKVWYKADPYTDSIPGVSLAKAYNFIKDKKGTPVIVAVIDGGVDIDHQDLRDNIWINRSEIPGNGLDDDHNGFTDDIHGWNFLGSSKGSVFGAQLEITRIVKKGMSFQQWMNPGKNKDDSLFRILYTKLKPVYDSLAASYSSQYEKLTAEYEKSPEDKDLLEYLQYLEDQNKYLYNPDFDPRELMGDDPDNLDDRQYGNNRVSAFTDREKHGTHVAGIIAATGHNGMGVRGVALNTRLMILRATTMGDEYDKDIALAIHYAVDNGARVINMSFGKGYSLHAEWVYDAIQYAAEHDVLLVHAAGNEWHNTDNEQSYPNDTRNSATEFTDNFINVGASTMFFNENLIAPFSNYGKRSVDIFAPGTEIYSTVPGNKYEPEQGTSMSAPIVTGIAALIRSYYPSLTAGQVKKIIMNSGISYDHSVIVPGSNLHTKNFMELSVSGKLVNAFNALKLAQEISEGAPSH